MEEMKNAHKILVTKHEQKRHYLVYLHTNERISEK